MLTRSLKRVVEKEEKKTLELQVSLADVKSSRFYFYSTFQQQTQMFLFVFAVKCIS